MRPVAGPLPRHSRTLTVVGGGLANGLNHLGEKWTATTSPHRPSFCLRSNSGCTHVCGCKRDKDRRKGKPASPCDHRRRSWRAASQFLRSSCGDRVSPDRVRPTSLYQQGFHRRGNDRLIREFRMPVLHSPGQGCSLLTPLMSEWISGSSVLESSAPGVASASTRSGGVLPFGASLRTIVP
jgi:hypothetical protein